MKNIIIDGQILQTSAWFRGMGKYTLQMARELSRASDKDLRVYIIFNDNIETESSRFQEVGQVCPKIKLLHYELPVPVNGGSRSIEYKNCLSECLAQDIVDGDNYYLISSLFTLDFFADFPDNCRGLLLFYDLIPLHFWSDLGQLFPPSLYMARFQIILEADLILAISSTTRNDLLKVFGLMPKTVVNINGGYTKTTSRGTKPSSLKVPEKYILFPTGDMAHKNNKLAVLGHAEYCNKSYSPMPLLITSYFSDSSKQELLALNGNIQFTDNVTDSELEWLYDHTKAVLFATKYEGLGLPILDAVVRDKPIICSRISVFEEISQKAFYYFDKEDPQDLALAIDNASLRRDFNEKKHYYADILSKYTWEQTAQSALRAISNLSCKENEKIFTKSRIAVATVYPGVSGLGRLAEQFHSNLSQQFEVDYYFDKDKKFLVERPSFLEYIDTRVFAIEELNFNSYHKYDLVIFLLDKHSFPSRVAEAACVLPGYVIINPSQLPNDYLTKMLVAEIIKNNYHCENRPFTGPPLNDNLLGSVHAAILERISSPKKEDVIIIESKTDSQAVRNLKKLLDK